MNKDAQIDRLNEIVTRWKARAEKAENELADYQDDYKAVMAEKCGDEKHCTCVPALRRKVTELEAALEQAREAIDALITTGNDLEAHEADPALRPWYAACHVGYAAIAALDAAGGEG